MSHSAVDGSHQPASRCAKFLILFPLADMTADRYSRARIISVDSCPAPGAQRASDFSAETCNDAFLMLHEAGRGR